ncbi:hypothetical protein N0V90_002355 [Kalmusia sp. IMI 367209]|nr:hypothetical protein N0V90_002355 [Kalmusia sp. IMI 367209]
MLFVPFLALAALPAPNHAAPAPAVHEHQSRSLLVALPSPSDPYEKIETREEHGSHGVIFAYSQPNFIELLTKYEGDACTPINFNYGEIKSIIQEPGSVCTYYQTLNCENSNHIVTIRHNTTNGQAYNWSDMGDYAGKILSFKCGTDLQARKANLQLSDVVTVYNAANFEGNNTKVNAWAKCSQNFNYGAIKSLKQQQGVLCHYYRSRNCMMSNHVPILRHDSKDSEWDAGELGKWSGKIQSFKCDTVAH